MFANANSLLLVLVSFSVISAHPLDSQVHYSKRTDKIFAPEFAELVEGNRHFRDSNQGLLKELAENGQHPPFMYLGCSDSRVSEGTVFSAKPGTFFTERNIANQFNETDPNADTILAYAVAHLGVKNIVVMGHYGCGGVAAAIASPPPPPISAADTVVQKWIAPIREIYQASNRSEIVELRNKNKDLNTVEPPELHEPGFRALVEENIKASVHHIASTAIISEHYTSPTIHHSISLSSHPRSESEPRDVFIHGWVYDIENGEVKDLGVSVGPAGKEIPHVPFAAVHSTEAH